MRVMIWVSEQGKRIVEGMKWCNMKVCTCEGNECGYVG